MKLLTFYKLNDEEKNALREDSPLEKKLKLLSQRNAELELQLKILKGKNRTAEDKIQNLEKENESFRYDISQYNTNNTALHARIDKLKQEIENLEQENAFLKLDNEVLKLKIIDNQNVSEENISYTLGDTVKLGDYNWTVIEIESQRILLLCNENIMTSIFKSNVLFSPVNWRNSTIRKWLNSEFLNTFSNADKEKIIITEHENVNDKVFLLDKSEFIRTKRNIFNINKEWWLRPSGTGYIEYYSVDKSLNLKINCEKTDEKAVRPAVYIKNNF